MSHTQTEINFVSPNLDCNTGGTILSPDSEQHPMELLNCGQYVGDYWEWMHPDWWEPRIFLTYLIWIREFAMNINTVQRGAIGWVPWKGQSETRTQVVYLGSNSREQEWGAEKCDREKGKPNRDSILYRSLPWAARDLIPLGSLQSVFQNFLLAVRRLELWSTGCVPYSWRLVSGQIMPPPAGACFAWEQRKSPPRNVTGRVNCPLRLTLDIRSRQGDVPSIAD